MINFKFESLRLLGKKHDFEVKEIESAFEIRFERREYRFCVTVAYCVLEWFVTIQDPEQHLEFHDWADYTGYDDTPPEELASEMEADLHKLVSAFESNQFRLTSGKTWLNSSDKCEWLVDAEWVRFDYGDI